MDGQGRGHQLHPARGARAGAPARSWCWTSEQAFPGVVGPKIGLHGPGLGQVAQAGAGAVGVDVPDLVGVAAEPSARQLAHRAGRAPAPCSSGRGDVRPVGAHAVAQHLGDKSWPRGRGRSLLPPGSTMPAPSDRTNPSRSLVERPGLARAGSSLRVDRARIAANPPRPMWVMAASLPPVIMASAWPNWIRLEARRRWRWPREAQAVAIGRGRAASGPYLIETWPLAALTISLGMVNGLIRDGPLLQHRWRMLGLELVQAADPRSDVGPPQRYGATGRPSRCPSARPRPASPHTRANWAKRSRWRASLTPKQGRRVVVAGLGRRNGP